MSQFLIAILLSAIQLLTGMGFLYFFKPVLKPALFLSLSLLCGILLFSLVPFLMQLLYIPVTSINIWIALLLCVVLLNLPFGQHLRWWKGILREARFRIRLYEWPFLLIVLLLVVVSVWRCYYYPPTPRDLNSGAEVIAEYAVQEKSMINSVFSVNLESTNNQFKPPFLTCLQIIYKYAGFPFGQVWLSGIFIAFTVFLYHVLVARVHRVLAGFLLICFMAIPEIYSYTFMALFDYSNMVFFFLSFYFLINYLDGGRNSNRALAGCMMGFATYIRSETLLLALLASPVILWWGIMRKQGIRIIIVTGSWFLVPAVLFYLLSITLYINHYLPQSYSMESLLNKELLNVRPLVQRFELTNSRLLFSSWGLGLYSYFLYIFLGILLLDLVLAFKLVGPVARNWLFAALVVYLGLPLLGFVLPLMDIDNTTKRGLFKLFPLLLLYMVNGPLLQRVSGSLNKWEAG